MFPWKKGGVGGREGSKKIGSVPGFQQHKEGSGKTPEGKTHAWY